MQMFTNEQKCIIIYANRRTQKMNYYSQKEFAEIVGVTVQTLKRWEDLGYIKPLRVIPHKPRYTDEHLKVLEAYSKQID